MAGKRPAKRKDKDRIVLRTGEGQRPNGTYEYRWTDRTGKRRRIYAKTLELLRDKFEIVALHTDDKTRLPEEEWVRTDGGKVLKDVGRVCLYVLISAKRESRP